jgi:hypothetical protein
MVLKRILTRKSILGFGIEYKDLSVQMVLDLGRKDFLICSYYNFDKIGFEESILDELGITDEYRIEKPGKSEKMRIEFFVNRKKQMTDLDFMKRAAQNKKENKIAYTRMKARDIEGRADYLRAKNHGNR